MSLAPAGSMRSVTAALETGCRIGELLSLRWQQVRFDLNEIHLRAEDTKAQRGRDIPMSQRFRGLLELRWLDRDGKEWAGTAYVFGDDATGARIKSGKNRVGTPTVKGLRSRREAREEWTADRGMPAATVRHQSAFSRSPAGSGVTIP